MSSELLVFLAFALLGGYVQTVAGFAMGMILVAASSALLLYPLPVTTAVISIISFLNIALSLPGHTQRVHRRAFVFMALGQLPAIAVGVALLTWLDATAQRALAILLGVFVIAGCASMAIRPVPRPELSSRAGFLLAGIGGGLLGGLFSAAAPIMGWFAYRQPLALAEIRATLLACFGVSTAVRTIVVGVDGGLTSEVWTLAAASVPCVLLSAFLGRRFPPPVSETTLKRGAFAMLAVMGSWILGTALV